MHSPTPPPIVLTRQQLTAWTKHDDSTKLNIVTETIYSNTDDVTELNLPTFVDDLYTESLCTRPICVMACHMSRSTRLRISISFTGEL